MKKGYSPPSHWLQDLPIVSVLFWQIQRECEKDNCKSEDKDNSKDKKKDYTPSLIAGFANCECSVCCDMFKDNVVMAISNQKTKTIQKTKRKTTLKSQSSHILLGLPILNVDKEKETWDNDNYKLLRTCVFLRHPYISAAQLRLGACANGSHTEQVQSTGWSQIFIV